MTLVTAICAPRWVALAADRRVTSYSALGLVRWQADVETKVAVVDGEYLAAFTGSVPVVDGTRGFERWLVAATSTYRGGSLPRHLLRDLTKRWRVEPGLSGERFMLILAGFRHERSRLVPDLRVISNSMDKTGEFSGHVPVGGFKIRPLLPLGTPNVVASRGYSIDEREFDPYFEIVDMREMSDSLREGMYQRLAGFYAEIGSQSGGVVGTDFIVATMPIESFGAQGLKGTRVIWGDGQTQITTAYLGPGAEHRDQYPAAFVSTGRFPDGYSFHGGRVALGDVKMAPRIPMTDGSPGNY